MAVNKKPSFLIQSEMLECRIVFGKNNSDFKLTLPVLFCEILIFWFKINWFFLLGF